MDSSTDGAPLIHTPSVSRPHSPANGASASAKAVVCVFCGSSPGTSPAHVAAAQKLGEAFAAHNISLIYGGGTTGLMGEIARTVVALSGPEAVHGVIPDALIQFEQQGRSGPADVVKTGAPKAEIDEKIYGRTTVVPDMHTRKQLMAKKVMEGGPGSGFIALSGGYGTLEELAEVITWNQLGIHGKGVVVFNVEGYYDGLIEWVKSAVTAGFIAPGSAGILVEGLDAEECVLALKEYRVAEGRLKLDWTQK
ncbi:MAG: hypothetical protein OHK93_003659 [Ramalina farinacea]|uniref:Cytokinin riboside 5'-monophosphate phosphoribohydrolase n=1 Tax=Ramalina farinacea TaxID=258253 RepID=A0AA43QTS9_9LECA|nr:hypothetical protein [Ramalina farinacea]